MIDFKNLEAWLVTGSQSLYLGTPREAFLDMQVNF